MKLFIVSKKMSTRLSSETQFYSDFKPLTNPQLIKQAEKLKSREMKERWWRMNDDDFKLMMGFGDGQTDRQTYVIVELVSWLKKGNFITLH